jgi:hypothetical protein
LFCWCSKFRLRRYFLDIFWVAIPRKFCYRAIFPKNFRLTFIFMLVQGAPKSKLPGAREDLNPALPTMKNTQRKNLQLDW